MFAAWDFLLAVLFAQGEATLFLSSRRTGGGHCVSIHSTCSHARLMVREQTILIKIRHDLAPFISIHACMLRSEYATPSRAQRNTKTPRAP